MDNNKKCKTSGKDNKRIEPDITNDQLGENAAEGRFVKSADKKGKNH